MRLAPLLLLAACAAPATPTLRYTGTLTPKAPSALCRPSRAVLLLQDGAVQFTPDEGTWRLEGHTGPNNTLTADRDAIGADKKPYATHLAATWTPEHLAGTYTTPRCTYTLDAAAR